MCSSLLYKKDAALQTLLDAAILLPIFLFKRNDTYPQDVASSHSEPSSAMCLERKGVDIALHIHRKMVISNSVQR